jgi:hypothetical protein
MQPETGSRGKKENGCPILDLKTTMINYTKEPRNAHKNNIKEKILQKI